MSNIDAKEAAKALNDITEIVRRVRQSRIYGVASEIMMLWGVLVLAGNLATYGWPRYGGYIWTGVNVLGVVGSFALNTIQYPKFRIRSFDFRVAIAFLLFFGFGLLCSRVLGHFGPREMGTFWPIYAMLFYALAGLWFGYAFVAIGLVITALTMAGYCCVAGAAFPLWMAVVNGGGLIVGGLWMRRE